MCRKENIQHCRKYFLVKTMKPSDNVGGAPPLLVHERSLAELDERRRTPETTTGKKCSGDSDLALDVPCIQCKCVKSKSACTRIENCFAETRIKLSSGINATLKMQIDPIKDQCTPGAIYTDHCNRCYCQPDSSLRCTQKTCLNYAQSKALDDQFKRLAEEGL